MNNLKTFILLPSELIRQNRNDLWEPASFQKGGLIYTSGPSSESAGFLRPSAHLMLREYFFANFIGERLAFNYFFSYIFMTKCSNFKEFSKCFAMAVVCETQKYYNILLKRGGLNS